MKQPIINLSKKNNQKETSVSEDVFYMYKDHMSTLMALFAAVLFSALFVFQSSHTGVLADHAVDDGTLGASVSSISMSGTSSDIKTPAEVEVVLFKDPFEDITIQGSAAYVFDVQSGQVLYEKNKDTVQPFASITKVMTALVSIKHASDQVSIQIRRADLAQEGSSGLIEGETWSLDDLRDFVLITSSNDGASAIANGVGELLLEKNASTADTHTPKDAFIKEMNILARDIGMEDSTFYNETGLDVSNLISGGKGTAEDVARLFVYILKEYPDLLSATRVADSSFESATRFQHIARNTNQDVQYTSGIISSKTGYTDLAGGNLAIAFDSSIGSPVVVVVLGSTATERFADVATLAHAAQEALAQGAYK